MFGRLRRAATASSAGVQFCDSCTEVSTSVQRAQRRYDRARTDLYAAIGRW